MTANPFKKSANDSKSLQKKKGNNYITLHPVENYTTVRAFPQN